MNVKFKQDRTDFWKSYFPVRNGIKPENFLKEGRNYTNETLYYMSKSRIAKNITERIETFLNGSPYFMIDMTAGIGGNTLDFLNSKNCVAVMSFEREPVRRLMLARNVMGYNLGDKSIIPNIDNTTDVIPVSGEEDFSSYKGALYFFDPPWLPESYKGGSDYKDHYIKEDIKVGELSLEDWLRKLGNQLPELGNSEFPELRKTKSSEENFAQFVIFRVPPGYQLKSVKGWSYVIYELGNDGRLIICIPYYNIKGSNPSESEIINTSVPDFDSKIMTSLMMKLKFSEEGKILTSQYSNFRNSCNALSLKDSSKPYKEDKCKIFVKWGFTDPQPLIELNPKSLDLGKSITTLQIKKDEYETEPQIISKIQEKPLVSKFTDKKIPIEQQVISLKEYSKPSNFKSLDKNSPEFVAEFQSYINWILRQFIKKEEDIMRLLEPGPMVKWIQAFTHESFEPSRDKNYDLLEIVGDRATEYVFSKILIEDLRNENMGVPDANMITQFKKEYMSTKWQVLTGQSMGFKDWIRIRDPFTDKLLEDVLESFIGALADNGDSIGRGFGYGINLCKKFILIITSKIKYDRNLFFGDPKSAFSQRFEAAFGGFMINNVFEKTNPIGSPPNLIYNVKLTVDAQKRLEKEGFVIPDRIVGRGKGANLTDVVKNAFYEANNFLDKIGFTNEFSRKIKETRNWSDIEAEDPLLVQQGKKKLEREGYNNFDLTVSQKGTSWIVRLDGYIEDKKSEVKLLGYGSDNDKMKAKIKAIRDYLEA